MLQTMKVSHNVNSDGWFTTLETQFRPLPDIKKPYMIDVEYQERPYLSPDALMEMLGKYNEKSFKSTYTNYGAEYDNIWGPAGTQSPNDGDPMYGFAEWGYSHYANQLVSFLGPNGKYHSFRD